MRNRSQAARFTKNRDNVHLTLWRSVAVPRPCGYTWHEWSSRWRQHVVVLGDVTGARSSECRRLEKAVDHAEMAPERQCSPKRSIYVGICVTLLKCRVRFCNNTQSCLLQMRSPFLDDVDRRLMAGLIALLLNGSCFKVLFKYQDSTAMDIIWWNHYYLTTSE